MIFDPSVSARPTTLNISGGIANDSQTSDTTRIMVITFSGDPQLHEIKPMKIFKNRIGQIATLLTVWACFLCIGAKACWAAITHRLDLPAMIESSQLIVVGQVIGTQRGEKSFVQIADYNTSGSWYTAKLRVSRVIKGDLNDPEITFRYFVPDSISYGRSVAEQYTGM